MKANEVPTVTGIDISFDRVIQDPYNYAVIGFEGSASCDNPITNEDNFDLGTGEFGLTEFKYTEEYYNASVEQQQNSEYEVSQRLFEVDYRPALKELGIEL